jgi:hypothetical protein
MARFQTWLHTAGLNYNSVHYAKKVVFDKVNELGLFTTHAQKTAEAIRANSNLTLEVKRAEAAKVLKETSEQVTKWSDQRMVGLNADRDTQRKALAPTPVKLEPARLDALSRHLEKYKPEEVRVFYNSAPDHVRAEMEAVSFALGSIPTRTDRGLEWLPLLDSDAVNEAVMSRAEAKNPQGAAKLRELDEVRGITQTAANIALADIKEALTL